MARFDGVRGSLSWQAAQRRMLAELGDVDSDLYAAVAAAGGGAGGPVAWDDVTDKPTFFDGAYSSLSGLPTLFDGAYASLTGKPTLFDGAYGSLTGKPTTFAPTAHASAHAHGGADLLRPMDIRAAQDVAPSAGEMSMPLGAVSNAGCATSNQVLRLVFFEAQRTETINNLTVLTGSTAAGATPTLVRLGVWSVNGSDDLTALLASTANDTSLLAGTNTTYTKALSSSWSKVAGTRYALGLLVVTGATAPQMTGQSVAATGLFTGGVAGLPRVTAALTGQTDLPSTASVGSYTTSASRPMFLMS